MNKGLVTLAKIPYVLCQQSLFRVEESCSPTNKYYILDMKIRLVQGHLKMGTRLADFFVNLKF